MFENSFELIKITIDIGHYTKGIETKLNTVFTILSHVKCGKILNKIQ